MIEIRVLRASGLTLPSPFGSHSCLLGCYLISQVFILLPPSWRLVPRHQPRLLNLSPFLLRRTHHQFGIKYVIVSSLFPTHSGKSFYFDVTSASTKYIDIQVVDKSDDGVVATLGEVSIPLATFGHGNPNVLFFHFPPSADFLRRLGILSIKGAVLLLNSLSYPLPLVVCDFALILSCNITRSCPPSSTSHTRFLPSTTSCSTSYIVTTKLRGWSYARTVNASLSFPHSKTTYFPSPWNSFRADSSPQHY